MEEKLEESERIELKRSLSDEEGILKSIVALANSKGGKVLIGVDEEKGAVGVKIGKNTVENLAKKISESIEPPLLTNIEIIRIGGKRVIEITVGESKIKPHFYKGVAYRRVGRINVKLTPQELLSLMKESKGTRFEEEIAEGGLEEIDEKAVKEFYLKAEKSGRLKGGKGGVRIILEKLNLKNAAILLFGKKPVKHFPYFSFRAAVSTSERFDIESLIDMRLFEGNIFQLIKEVSDYLEFHLPKKIEVEGLRRVEKPFIPKSVIREIVVNSLIHRDFAAPSPNYLLITPTFFEVYNPGGLLPQLKVEDLYKEHSSALRNPLCARVAYYAGYVDEWGNGTVKILHACAKEGVLPKFYVKNNFFYVRIPYEGESTEEKILKNLGKPQRAEEIAKKVGLSERRVRSYLGKLIAMGVVEKKRKGRRVVYSLA